MEVVIASENTRARRGDQTGTSSDRGFAGGNAAPFAKPQVADSTFLIEMVSS
jgi:hypothetical protein